MSRINYPNDFLNQAILFSNIKKKHDADGQASPLIPFLAQQGIDLDADEQAVSDAVKENKKFEQTDKNSEDYTQNRNNLFNPVFAHLRNMLQFLKTYYAGNPKELGHWGAVVDDNRIVYPAKFLMRAELFTAVKKQHDSLGNASPLGPFLVQNNIDINKLFTAAGNAGTQHEKMLQAKRNAEKYSEQRNKLFDPVFTHVRAIAQYLKTLFIENAKKLGEWGYTVDDSPRPPQFRVSIIAPATTKTIRGIKLNSQLENTGTTGVLLHKGKAVGNNPVSLLPEMHFTIARGWGTTTVQNASTANNGQVGYITTRI